MLKTEIKEVNDINESLKDNPLFMTGDGYKINYIGKKNDFHVFKKKAYEYYYYNNGTRVGDSNNKDFKLFTFKRKN